jgi:hypothetical protein
MTPYTGAVVLVNVDAAHNGGSPYAPALVTRCDGDDMVNVRVLYDGPPSHLHPQGHHRPEWLTGVRFHDTSDLAQASKQGLYGAFWPPGPDLTLAILEKQEKIMSELSQQQTDINAAATALTSAATTISTVATDLGTVLANIQAQLAALQAANPAVDTSALDTAVSGISAPLAALQAADAALDAIETPAAPAAPAAPASGDSAPAA